MTTSHGITLPETADTVRKVLLCLGCDAPMLTDRAHRFCKRCSRRNEATRLYPPHRLSLPVGARHTVAPPEVAEPWRTVE